MINLNGIKEGFYIIVPDCLSHPVEIDNYTPAMEENVCALVESQFFTEIQNGRYRIIVRKPAIILALGAIPKRIQTMCILFKMLVDLQDRPYAINDHFQYQSTQDYCLE